MDWVMVQNYGKQLGYGVVRMFKTSLSLRVNFEEFTEPAEVYEKLVSRSLAYSDGSRYNLFFSFYSKNKSLELTSIYKGIWGPLFLHQKRRHFFDTVC